MGRLVLESLGCSADPASEKVRSKSPGSAQTGQAHEVKLKRTTVIEIGAGRDSGAEEEWNGAGLVPAMDPG